jgi:hypothetical protein
VRWARNAVDVNLLGADVCQTVYRESAGRAKWGENSRMSREGDSNYGQEQARVYKSYTVRALLRIPAIVVW